MKLDNLTPEDLERITVQSSIDQMKNHEKRIQLILLSSIQEELKRMGGNSQTSWGYNRAVIEINDYLESLK